MSTFFPLNLTRLKLESRRYFISRAVSKDYLRARNPRRALFNPLHDIPSKMKSINLPEKPNNEFAFKKDSLSNLNEAPFYDDLVQFGLSQTESKDNQQNSNESPISLFKSIPHLIKTKRFFSSFNEIDKFIIMNSEIEEKGKSILCYNIMSSLKFELNFSKFVNSLFYPYYNTSNMIVLAAFMGLLVSYAIRYDSMQNTFFDIISDYPIDVSDLPHFYHVLDEAISCSSTMKVNLLISLLGFSQLFFERNSSTHFYSKLPWNEMMNNRHRYNTEMNQFENSYDKNNFLDECLYEDFNDDSDDWVSNQVAVLRAKQNMLKQEIERRNRGGQQLKQLQKKSSFKLSKQSDMKPQKVSQIQARKDKLINEVYQKWKAKLPNYEGNRPPNLHPKSSRMHNTIMSLRNKVNNLPIFNVAFNYSLVNEIQHNLIVNFCEKPLFTNSSYAEPNKICFCEFRDQIESYKSISPENCVTNYIYNDDYYKRMYNYAILHVIHQSHVQKSKEICYSILPEIVRRNIYQYDKPIYNSVSFDSYGRSELTDMFKSNFNKIDRSKSKLMQFENFIEKVEIPELVCAMKTNDKQLLAEIKKVKDDPNEIDWNQCHTSFNDEYSPFQKNSEEFRNDDDSTVSSIMGMLDRLGKDKAMRINQFLKKNNKERPSDNIDASKQLEKELRRIRGMDSQQNQQLNENMKFYRRTKNRK